MADGPQLPRPVLLTAKECAAMLGIHERQFKSLVRNGRFPLPFNWDGSREVDGNTLKGQRWDIEDVKAYLYWGKRAFAIPPKREPKEPKISKN